MKYKQHPAMATALGCYTPNGLLLSDKNRVLRTGVKSAWLLDIETQQRANEEAIKAGKKVLQLHLPKIPRADSG